MTHPACQKPYFKLTTTWWDILAFVTFKAFDLDDWPFQRNFGLEDDKDLLAPPVTSASAGSHNTATTQSISQSSLYDLIRSFPDTGIKMDIDDCDLSSILDETLGHGHQPNPPSNIKHSPMSTPVMSPIYEVTGTSNGVLDDNQPSLLPGLLSGDQPGQKKSSGKWCLDAPLNESAMNLGLAVQSLNDNSSSNHQQMNHQNLFHNFQHYQQKDYHHHTSETSSNASSCSSMSGWTHSSGGATSTTSWTSGSGNSSPLLGITATSSLPLKPPGSQSSARAQGVRQFSAGALDTIPEHEMTEPPRTFQPLIPPPIVPRPPPATSYNISFPTTLQPRDRFDIWRNPNNPSVPSPSNPPITAKPALAPSFQSPEPSNSRGGMMNFRDAFEQNVKLQVSTSCIKKEGKTLLILGGVWQMLRAPSIEFNSKQKQSALTLVTPTYDLRLQNKVLLLHPLILTGVQFHSRGSSPSPSTQARAIWTCPYLLKAQQKVEEQHSHTFWLHTLRIRKISGSAQGRDERAMLVLVKMLILNDTMRSHHSPTPAKHIAPRFPRSSKCADLSAVFLSFLHTPPFLFQPPKVTHQAP